jgi:xanthine dehydrogenase accessory factor
MPSIWKAIQKECSSGRKFVVGAILSVKGSSPRHVGTRFIVKEDGGIVGSIGGGLFESRVRALAAQAIKDESSQRSEFAFTGEDAGSNEMICGGTVEVLIEYVGPENGEYQALASRINEIILNRDEGMLLTDMSSIGEPNKSSISRLLIDQKTGAMVGGFARQEIALEALPEHRLLRPAQLIEVSPPPKQIFVELLKPRGTVFILGAGHVGICVAHLASYVDFQVVVLDDREEYAAPDKVPAADEVLVLESFDNAFAAFSLDEDSYVVIVTRGHAHDRTVLEQALKTDAGYIGMIGSRRKTKLIYQSMLLEGFTEEDLARVHAPIGLPIGGETPQEIAVSIVAQLISARDAKTSQRQGGRHMSCPA